MKYLTKESVLKDLEERYGALGSDSGYPPGPPRAIKSNQVKALMEVFVDIINELFEDLQ